MSEFCVVEKIGRHARLGVVMTGERLHWPEFCQGVDARVVVHQSGGHFHPDSLLRFPDQIHSTTESMPKLPNG